VRSREFYQQGRLDEEKVMMNLKSTGLVCGFAFGVAAMSIAPDHASALQYYDFTGSPGATVTLAETAPGSGVFNFRDDYIWNTNTATLEDDGATLGPWAASAFDYSVYQNTSVRNTLDLEGAFDHVIYHFAVPVPSGRQLGSITVEAAINRGVHARARANDAAGWTDQPALLIPGPNLDPPLSALVPSASIDLLSTPGYANFQLKFEQESGNFGYLDFLNVTANTSAVPEPMALSALAMGSTLLLTRRRASSMN
jgi:hypothetical protein